MPVIIKRVTIRISGLVQGVSFRYYTKVRADNLGLAGWARNNLDGSLTIVVEGEENKLKKLINWVKKGTPSARVSVIETEWEKPRGEGKFEVRYE